MLVLPLPLLLLLLFLLFLSLLLFASPGLLEIEESGEEEGGESSAVSTRRPAPPPPPRDEKEEDVEEGIEAAAASSAAERDAPRFSAGNISFSFKARYFPNFTFPTMFFFAEFRVFNTKSKRKGGETRKRERAEEIENITSTDDTIDTKIEKTITKWIFAIGPTNRK